MSPFYRSFRLFRGSIVLRGVLAAVIVLALNACDTGGADDDEMVRVRGTVTDEAAFGKRAANVEGATVTAASVDADGQVLVHDAETATDEDGRYTLHVDAATDVLLVMAEDGDAEFRTLAVTRGRTEVEAQPMTVESRTEADVYLEAKERDGDHVTVADVAAYVDGQVSADVVAGGSSAADVAVALVHGISAELAYIDESEGDEVDDEEIRDEKAEAFVRLQAELAAAESGSAASDALRAFEESLAAAYVEADVSAESGAHARQAGAHATISATGDVSSGTAFVLRKHAEWLAAQSTAIAVEATMQADGASDDRLDALAEARADLAADIRTAASVNAIGEAKAAYETAVHEQLAAHLDASVSAIEAAVNATTTARTTLQAALTAVTTARAVAQAYATFVTSAEAAAEASLSSTSDAGSGTTVVVLLSGMLSLSL